MDIDLVDVDKPRARIADLGAAIVTRSLNSTQHAAGQREMTLCWAAPEVLNNENPIKQSDVFSFALITIQVCCG